MPDDLSQHGELVAGSEDCWAAEVVADESGSVLEHGIATGVGDEVEVGTVFEVGVDAPETEPADIEVH